MSGGAGAGGPAVAAELANWAPDLSREVKWVAGQPAPCLPPFKSYDRPLPPVHCAGQLVREIF